MYVSVSLPTVAFHYNIIDAIVSESHLDLFIYLICAAFFKKKIMAPKCPTVPKSTKRARTIKRLRNTSNGEDRLRIARLRATESQEQYAVKLLKMKCCW